MYKISSVLHYHQRNNFDSLVCNLPCASKQKLIILTDPNKFAETSKNKFLSLATLSAGNTSRYH